MKKIIINFRVTEEEYAKIKKKTERAGIRNQNVSEYVRRQVLGAEYPYLKEKLLRSMNYQIRKIGVNINQIAARYNSGIYLSGDKEQLEADVKKLYQLFYQFRKDMYSEIGNE